eukprot:gb/GEZN01003063.1/.p1 GENE.gb/GEZN01003063.1/~~gb/GEZN01003063.1/.p1  ORF type:complete len:717 (-),score=147.76 gb/GEZN01003063.1/:95-2245(-)
MASKNEEGDKPDKGGGKKEKGDKAEKGGSKQEKRDKKEQGGGSKPLPSFIQERIKLWDQWHAEQEEKAKTLPRKPITVTLPDGKSIEAEGNQTTPYDIVCGISKQMAKRMVAAKVNGVVTDLWRPMTEDSALELLDFKSKEGAHVYWHSSAHVLGQALELCYEDAKLCIGPALEDGGFYYDVFLPKGKTITEGDYKALEKQIKVITKNQPFERLVLHKHQALEMFKDNKFKQEVIQKKVPDGATCTAYRCGPLIDLCKGPHVPNTNIIKAYSVYMNSSSYWLGKAENESLQRVYGISFPDNTQLNQWTQAREEAKARDHRNVGPAQELFFVHDLSPGSAFFLPHGARIYNRLIDFIKTEYRKRGYQEVMTPNMFSMDLFKISGHYANYYEDMFVFKSEKQEFALKPMNCPGHCLMFKHRLRSYRELPVRFADFGVLHRNELSGALSGLTRVRRFQQDDAHIFCRLDQIKSEVAGVLDMMKYVYGLMGYTFTLQLSTRPAKYMGELSKWDDAEIALAQVLSEFGQEWTINEADGAFYGPKIDIQLMDAIGRKHQCATIQLDFQLPLRFGLSYKDDNGKPVTPVIVHRAILGSVERQMAVLIEHTAGKWPFWLSPRQVKVIPISEKSMIYAKEVEQLIFDAGYYVETDESDNQVKKKVRNACVEQWNFMAVVGEKEIATRMVNVRFRDAPDRQEPMTLDAFLVMLKRYETDKIYSILD